MAQGVKQAVDMSLGPHDAAAPLLKGSTAAGGDLVRAALFSLDAATAAADTLASAEFDADAACGGGLTYEKLRAMLDSLTLQVAGAIAAPAPDAGLVMLSSTSSRGGGNALIETRNGNANANPLTRANSLAERSPANGTHHQRIEKAPPKARPKQNRVSSESSFGNPDS